MKKEDTRMNDNKQDDKELISYIAEVLKEYSTSYKEGAWEKFASVNVPVRKRILWPYLSGAAMLLLAGSLFWLRSPEVNKQVVSRKIPITQEIKTETATETPASTTKILISRGKQEQIVRPKYLRISIATALSSVLPATPKVNLAVQNSVADVATHSSQRDIFQEDRFLKLLQRDQGKASSQESEKSFENTSTLALNRQKKWDYSIALAPATTRDRFNFGGGLEVAYRLNDRISVGTGISVAGLGVQRSDRQIYSPRVSASSPQASLATGLTAANKLAAADEKLEDKQLESVRTSVLGLDIPLNFKYAINKYFYASAGASIFAVVNETRTNVYAKQVTSTENFSSINGASAVKPIIETVSVSEKTAEQPLRNSNFNGFINFSVGHRIPLSGKFQLGLEPFIKLPIGRAAKQDVNLSYGGIKLSAGF
ncbi:Outer membrane protein beta-barrel domain-containing protein [bacterium A37T11]|nr:Outer membrane protein beta-barrel domain-containing protein [bacterium A37T11]